MRIGSALHGTILVAIVIFTVISGLSGCASDKEANRAKMTGVKYWVDKAYPGKAHDVQVTEATKTDDGKYRVKALVDGETRVGIYDPKTENFDEGFYSLAYEKTKKVAELEEENRYLKDRVEKLEKELYQIKLRMKYIKRSKADPEDADDAAATKSAPAKSNDEE
jgi:hypothetical protein